MLREQRESQVQQFPPLLVSAFPGCMSMRAGCNMEYRDEKDLRDPLRPSPGRCKDFYLSIVLLVFPEVTLNGFMATAEPNATASPSMLWCHYLV